VPNLDIIPSSKRHKNTQLNIAKNETGNNNVILKRALSLIRDSYDFILIDNAPANDILTVNSLFISDLVIVPVRLEGFSYKGLRETIDTLLYIKNEHDIESIKFGGAFITQAEINTNIYKALKSNYTDELGGRFYETPIRKDIHISELETNFTPLLEYCPNTNAVFDYSNLILELGILDDKTSAMLRRSIGA
jgi:chromosome partitioning protein parA